jgi:hypothetical protein
MRYVLIDTARKWFPECPSTPLRYARDDRFIRSICGWINKQAIPALMLCRWSARFEINTQTLQALLIHPDQPMRG